MSVYVQCMFMCARWGLRSTSGAILQALFTFLRQGLSLDVGLTWLARQARQWVLGTCLSLPPHSPSAGMTNLDFYVGSGAFMLACHFTNEPSPYPQQAFYKNEQLSKLLAKIWKYSKETRWNARRKIQTKFDSYRGNSSLWEPCAWSLWTVLDVQPEEMRIESSLDLLKMSTDKFYLYRAICLTCFLVCQLNNPRSNYTSVVTRTGVRPLFLRLHLSTNEPELFGDVKQAIPQWRKGKHIFLDYHMEEERQKEVGQSEQLKQL